MDKLRLSKHLQIIKRPLDYAVYHSLYGQLCLLDNAGIDFLKLFHHPVSREDVYAAYPQYPASVLENYINQFTSRLLIAPEDFDEYSFIAENRAIREKSLDNGYLVRALQLITSNSCNFKCKYCFVDNRYDSKERAEFQRRPSNMSMSYETAALAIEKLIELQKKHRRRNLYIEFFGGEPLTNWPVIEAVLENFKNGQNREMEIVYSITTNGSLITEKMAEVFKKYNVTVTISFDSPKNTERILADGRNVFDLTRKSLEILRRHQNWTTFNSVLSRETLHQFDGKGLVDFALNYQIGMIGLILDLDLEFYQSETNKAKVVEEIINTYQYAASRNLPVVGYWHQIFNQITGKQLLNLHSGYKTCPATGCKLSVEPEGHIFICKCCSGYLGHINSLEGALHSPKYREYSMQAYRNAPECEGCEIEGFCSGVCMGSLEKKYHDIQRIEKSSCQVFRELTRRLIENLDAKEAYQLYMPKPMET
ncbi:MAG: radical SAM protein [Firmicutes bacterium]|nr:radical SAM protein [Bacillota bacterium]